MLRQLNCFSNKKKRKRGKKKLVDNENHRLLLASPSGSSSSTSATRRIGSPDTANTSISLSRLSSQQSNNRDPSNDDNSIPTLDSDYNNIQSGTFSVSDAGGTLGSGGTNNKSLSNFSSALGFGLSPSVSGPSSSLAGNNNNQQQQHPYHQHLIQSPYTTQREEYIEIYAPMGKLGIVIDTPMSSSTPIVHAIKDTCPIKNEIYVGDKLVAVDDVDVRDYQAVDVSMLIGNRSNQKRRKLTIIRTAWGRDGMY